MTLRGGKNASERRSRVGENERQLALPIGHLCEQKQKNCVFVHIHNSCARNGDHVTFLIDTGNAHKRMLSQTLIYTFRKV